MQRSLDFGPTATEVLPPPKDGAAPMLRPDPDPSGTVLPPSGAQDPLQVVLTGMAQLQGMVAGLANSPKNEQKYETIKPGVNSLPELPAPGRKRVFSLPTGCMPASLPYLMSQTPVSSFGIR